MGTFSNRLQGVTIMGIKQNYQEAKDTASGVTVEQFYVGLWRFAGCPKGNIQDPLRCAKGMCVSDYAKEAVAWAHSAGLIQEERHTLNMTQVLNKAEVAIRFMQCMDLGVVYGQR